MEHAFCSSGDVTTAYCIIIITTIVIIINIIIIIIAIIIKITYRELEKSKWYVAMTSAMAVGVQLSYSTG